MRILWVLCYLAVVHAYANYEEEARIRHIRSTKAYLANATNEADDADEGRFGGNFVTSVMNDVVMVYNSATNDAVGPGIVVATKWVLCSSLILSSTVQPGGVQIFSGVIDSTPSSLAAGTKHTVLKIIRHQDINDKQNSLMLLQGCPGFKSVATLPPFDKTYPIGTQTGFLHIVPTKLKLANKKVGEVCECETICPGWDDTKQICLEESTSAYNTEFGALLYQNNVFAGINMCKGNANGEAYLDITKYLSFISDNAV